MKSAIVCLLLLSGVTLVTPQSIPSMNSRAAPHELGQSSMLGKPLPYGLMDRAMATVPKPKFSRRPPSRQSIPHHRPKACTQTELVTNGNFDRSVRDWDWIPEGRSQFFWVKSSRKTPAHSGQGQAYIFLNRGQAGGFLTTSIPAIEFANTVTVSAWLRYDSPADSSGCSIQFTDNFNTAIYLDLTLQWTKYSFETAGTGRAMEVQFRITCSNNLPITVHLDDVSATACVPKTPNPACQILPGAQNFLVNGGFECPEGVLAWRGTSLFGSGNESIAQISGGHSGNGMAGILLDNSQAPFSGVLLYQSNINHDMSRASSKASLWLSLDSRLNKAEGCLLNVATSYGNYILDLNISNLTTAWSFFEVSCIQTATSDTLYISISGCTNPQQPLFYVDDVYLGIDPLAGPAPAVPSPTPTPSPPPGPCTTVPTLVDSSFEVGDDSNWLFIDFSANFDAMFTVENASTYGAAHSGNNVGVLTLPSGGKSQLILIQELTGLCNDQVYSSSVWMQVAPGYDASRCQFSYAITAGSDPIPFSPAGTWTKFDLTFLANIDSASILPNIQLRVSCHGDGEMIVLVDDISFGLAPPCKVSPSIPDGGFESGELAPWSPGFAEGDETAVITTSKAHTGTKSVLLNFPSTANGAGFFREFTACIGQKLTFSFWYYVPKAYRTIPCSVSASAWYTGDFILENFVLFDTRVQASLNFTAGASTAHVDFSVSCSNQMQKVMVYLDDVAAR